MTNEAKRNIAGMLCACACEIFFGFSFIFTKKLSGEIDPISLLSWRFVIAFAGINAPLLCGLIKLDCAWRDLWRLVPLGLCVPMLYFLGETYGIQLTTATESSVMIACIPVATMILSSLVYRRWPSLLASSGIILTVCGVICCVVSKGMEATFSACGYLLLLVAVLSYPFFCIMLEKLPSFSSFAMTYVMMMTGAIGFTITALIKNSLYHTTEAFLKFPFSSADNILSILYLGLGCSVCGFFLFNAGVRLIGSNRTISFAGMATVVAVIAGVIILEESFTIPQYIGTGLVVLGITLVNLKQE